MAADKSTRPGEREAKYAAADLKLQPARGVPFSPLNGDGFGRGGGRDPSADLWITQLDKGAIFGRVRTLRALARLRQRLRYYLMNNMIMQRK
jgi:hypothetical protein